MWGVGVSGCFASVGIFGGGWDGWDGDGMGCGERGIGIELGG